MKLSASEAGKLGGIKRGEFAKKEKKLRITNYNKNPKICQSCYDPLSYEKRKQKFCSHSCAAKSCNKGIRRHGRPKRICINCKVETYNPKYCSNTCQRKFEWKIKKEKIEKGNVHSPVTLKKYLVEKNGHKCSVCKLEKWRDQPIGIILDHVDGNSENNLPSNLRLVCGNCDMQLPTYKAKNKGNGRFARRKRYTEGKSY